MCSERDLRSTIREGPVDRQGICYCSVPESIQVVLRKIRILSFEDSSGVGSSGDNISGHAPSDRVARAAKKLFRGSCKQKAA
jgi:hypothetical protein